MMTWEMGFVAIVVLLMMVALMTEILRPDLVLITALFSFVITGILTPTEAIHGLSNEGMLTIALLCVMGGAVKQSGVFERLVGWLLRDGTSQRRSLARLLFPVSMLSGVLNNTPIVATLTPIIRNWCDERGLPASKYLLPLSYATIAGGTVTLIGTSTNLVVHGVLIEQGLDGFSFFQLAIIGVPLTIVLILFLCTFGLRLLPNNGYVSATSEGERVKKYVVEMVVETGSRLAGRSLREAGLWKEEGVTFHHIARKGEYLQEIGPSFRLKAGDRMMASADIETLMEWEKTKEMRPENRGAYGQSDRLRNSGRLVEVMVLDDSTLIGKRLKQIRFRRRFDAAVLGIRRPYHRMRETIGDIILQPGDVLLLVAGEEFEELVQHKQEMYIVSAQEKPSEKASLKTWLPLITLVVVMGLMLTGILSLFVSVALGVLFLLLTGILHVKDASDYMPFQVLLVIAAALGIGEAMVKTGLASYVADILVTNIQPLGLIALLVLLYVLTNVFTELITNNAAAIMMIPVAMEVASQWGISVTPLAVIVAIAASASFMTPIGYQTNLMVYGPGGYKFIDYMKLGLPVSILMMTVTVTITYIVWI